jgi:hypothetical protein
MSSHFQLLPFPCLSFPTAPLLFVIPEGNLLLIFPGTPANNLRL